MARRPRIHFPGACYHVIARGNRQQKIFLEDEDYVRYLAFLQEYKQRYRFLLYAYVLMPDHVHFLIEVVEIPLSRPMQVLQSRYSRNFNDKYHKRGHLFQGRYRAILCQKDSFSLELSAYIHLGAVRAGIVEDPGEYPWSSYGCYVRQDPGDGFPEVEVDYLLGQLSEQKSVAREMYESFVMDRVSDGHREDFYKVKEQCFLGSDEFLDAVQRSLGRRRTSAYRISLSEIVSSVGAVLQIPTGLFYTRSRNRQGALGRSVTGYLARKLSGWEVKAVADHFDRDPAVISQGMRKVEQGLWGEGNRFGQYVTEIENALAGSIRKRPEEKAEVGTQPIVPGENVTTNQKGEVG